MMNQWSYRGYDKYSSRRWLEYAFLEYKRFYCIWMDMGSKWEYSSFWNSFIECMAFSFDKLYPWIGDFLYRWRGRRYRNVNIFSVKW